MTAVEVFKDSCSKRGIRKPSSALQNLLMEAGDIDEIEELMIEDLYLGNRTLMALLDLVRKAKSFRAISLVSQKIYNADLSEDSIKGNDLIDHLVNVCEKHPSITSLDLSGNPLSNFAGRKLLQLANANERIVVIDLHNTRIDSDLVSHVNTMCQKNLRVYWERQNEDDIFGTGNDTETTFGTFTYVPPRKKAPDLSGIGGGKRRNTIFGPSPDLESAKAFVCPEYPKDKNDEATIIQYIKETILFGHLSTESLIQCVNAFELKKYPKGTPLITEGECGSEFFLVKEGYCTVTSRGHKVGDKKIGSSIGCLELLHDKPSQVTVTAQSDVCVVWVIKRDTYIQISVSYTLRTRAMYEVYLGKVQFLQTLSPSEKLQLSDALLPDEFQPGDYIIHYGVEGECMFLLMEGTVEVLGRNNVDEVCKVCEFSEGDHFGELEFLNNHKNVTDIVARTHVRTAKINRSDFERCLGPVISVLKRDASDPKYEYYKKQLEMGTANLQSKKWGAATQ
eukprot:TRINITY_DN22815_c0_g1_i1.p1 TRINITY_DN22815_c0_g1~~TRINITY_DN22815_c0_g1_i1.p1  ORF type:complete len:507 (+),score=69.76 TRINITY_DN22815_c0_g1_i1:108-1628(+)